MVIRLQSAGKWRLAKITPEAPDRFGPAQIAFFKVQAIVS
jgi:hypothetical protein